MKVLLPVDGSPYTKRMLEYIAAHDEVCRPTDDYIAFTAVPPIPPHAARFVSRETVDDYSRDQAEQVLEPVRAFAEKNGWKLRTAHAAGHAAEAIANFAAAEKPDLIVMGTHGHAPLRNMILGSVTSGVLARCKVPVLLVP